MKTGRMWNENWWLSGTRTTTTTTMTTMFIVLCLLLMSLAHLNNVDGFLSSGSSSNRRQRRSPSPPGRGVSVGSNRPLSFAANIPFPSSSSSSSERSRTTGRVGPLRVHQAEQNKEGFMKDDYSEATRQTTSDNDDAEKEEEEPEDSLVDADDPIKVVNGDSTSLPIEKQSTISTTTTSSETSWSTLESDVVDEQQAQLDEEFMGMAIEIALSG